MINNIPDSWNYNDNMENLFFFYQCSEELLSINSPDTFRLPVCNSMVLCFEIRRIYRFLADSKQIERYYSKYIPCIIDELIKTIQQDYILKHKLGLRLNSVYIGLETAKENHQELLKWISIIRQSCTVDEHKEKCEELIISYIKAGNNKSKLLWVTTNYYIDLIVLGYSREYLYQSVIKFFDNHYNSIQNNDVIDVFLKKFDCEESNYEFWLVADTYRFDSLSRIDPQVEKSFDIHEIKEEEIKKIQSHGTVTHFYNVYQRLKSNDDPNIKMLSCKATGIDPYSAFYDVKKLFDMAQCFEGYFKHKSESKTIFDILLVKESDYSHIKVGRIIPRRPYIDQSIIDKRIDTIMSSECCPMAVIWVIFKAIDMHLDAINCKNEETMLRSFWTALESLFFTSDETEQKENVKYCILHIIQKTYLLKQFRLVYEQFELAINDKTYTDKIGIRSFQDFIYKFISTKIDEVEFRQFTNRLDKNPLLRSRLFWLKKDMNNPDSVRNKIENHYQKVSWQIDRIYRTRNLSTHAGVSMPYISEILFNIHNYFDYIINYIICKLENKSYIQSISSMVFEAKNDNQIHITYLKNEKEISNNNYLNVLFGPDLSIIHFDFEAIITKKEDE